jgi:signal transduction histidine kinase
MKYDETEITGGQRDRHEAGQEREAISEQWRGEAQGDLKSRQEHGRSHCVTASCAAKGEADSLEFSPVDFIFREMVQRVESVIGIRANDKKQSFEVKLDSAIPRFLYGDERRLAQVITSLLGNAVEFTPQGGTVRLEVFVKERIGPEYVSLAIRVSDTGIGMDPQKAGMVFPPSTQADADASRRFGGTGQGLSASKRLIELMGGTISVGSKPGCGAVFTCEITLPVGDAAVAYAQRMELGGYKEGEFEV